MAIVDVAPGEAASPNPRIPPNATGWRVWWGAARPRTLPLAVAPVLVGSALAANAGSAQWLPALAALAGALLLQVGSNFANDVFDAVRGADGDDRIGPPRAVQMGWISPLSMQWAAAAAFAAAAAVGLYLVALGGWPVLAIGVASIAAGFAYTGGPYPLGYHGMGDITVFVFFGLVAVGGTYYVQALSLAPNVLIAAVPVGGLATAVLVVNNLRDVDSDARAGKRTLAVRGGRAAARAEYATLLAVAYLTPVALWWTGGVSVWALLPLVSAPRAVQLVRVILTKSDGPALNAALAGTAALAFSFALLFAGGLVV